MDPDPLDLLRHSLPSSSPPPSTIAGPSSSSSSTAPLPHLPLVLPTGRSISLLSASPYEPLPPKTRLPQTHATLLRSAAKSLFLPPFHQGVQKDRIIKQLASYLSLPVPRVKRFLADEEKKIEKERVEREKKRKKGKGKAGAGVGKVGKGKEREVEVEVEVEVVVEVDAPKKRKTRAVKKDLPCLGGAYSASALLPPAQSSSSLSPIPVARPESPFLLYSFDPATQQIEVSDVKELLADLLPPQPPQPTSSSQHQLPFDIMDESSSSSQSNVTADLIDYQVPCQEDLIPVGTLIFDPNGASSDLVVPQQESNSASRNDHCQLSNSLSFLITDNDGPSNPSEPQNDLLSFPSFDGDLDPALQMEPFSENQAAVGFERFDSSSPLQFSFDLPSPTSGSNTQELVPILLPSPKIKPVVVVEEDLSGADEDVEMSDLEETVEGEKSCVGEVVEEVRDVDDDAAVEWTAGVELVDVWSSPPTHRTSTKLLDRRVRSLPASPLSSARQPLQPFRSHQHIPRKRPLSPSSDFNQPYRTRTPSFLPSSTPVFIKSYPCTASKRLKLETSTGSVQEQSNVVSKWSLDGTLVVEDVLLE